MIQRYFLYSKFCKHRVRTQGIFKIYTIMVHHAILFYELISEVTNVIIITSKI